jgi:PTS system cellobiose-specific IIC component
MKTTTTPLSERIIATMNKIAANRYLTAIRNGFAVIIPITLIGSVFSIIVNFPIPAWHEFIAPFRARLAAPADLTLGFLALYGAIGIGSSLAEHYNIDKTSASILSAAAYLVANTNINSETWAISVGDFGAAGLFTAIVTAIFSVEVLRFFIKHKLVIKMPHGVPVSVINSFMVIVPGLVVVTVLWLIKDMAGFSINSFLQTILTPLRFIGASNNLISVIFTILLVCVFWMVGIHGSVAVAGPLLSSFWLTNLTANMNAGLAGEALPNFLTEPFFQWFIWIGGAGATVALAFLMAFFSKSAFCKKIGRLTFIPGIFNINEPLMFGIPIVMNPAFAVPFILAPLIMGLISYIAIAKLQLVSYAISIVPWTLPAPVGAFLSTTDWRAIPLALINITAAVFIYLPFFKIFDRQMLKKELEELENT